MSQFDAVVNRLPAPTWNRLRLNEVQISVPEEGTAGSIKIETPDNIVLEHSAEAMQRFASVPTGSGEDVDRILAAPASAAQVNVFTSSCPVEQPVKLFFNLRTPQERHFVGIEAKENAVITVLMEYGEAVPSLRDAEQNRETASEKAAEESTAVIQTKIIAAEGSLVRLVQIHRGEDNETILSDTGSTVADGARVEIVHVILTGRNNLIGSRTELLGDNSSLKTDIGYRVEQDHIVDMNYIANHYGRHTLCDIDCLGVLHDTATKVFRGTIDFKKGSKASLGNEKEDVLLMDDGVVNKTIPLILCAEEDVEGNHGATIGQLDQDAMFYLESRGMTKEAAMELLERGRLASIIRRIPDEQTVNGLLELIGE